MTLRSISDDKRGVPREQTQWMQLPRTFTTYAHGQAAKSLRDPRVGALIGPCMQVAVGCRVSTLSAAKTRPMRTDAD